MKNHAGAYLPLGSDCWGEVVVTVRDEFPLASVRSVVCELRLTEGVFYSRP